MLPPNDYLSMKDYELNRLPDVLARAEQNRLLARSRPDAPAPARRTFGVAHVPGVPIALAAGTPVGVTGQRLERRYAR